MPSDDALITALKLVDAIGDISDRDPSGPSQVAIREIVLRKGMARWSDEAGRFVLTTTGRARLSARPRSVSSAVLPFPSRITGKKALRQA